jgi:hypothetical protein
MLTAYPITNLSFTAHPVHGPALQIHHRKHSQFVLFDGIQEGVGESGNKSASYRPDDQLTRLRMFRDGSGTALKLVKKGRSESWTYRS